MEEINVQPETKQENQEYIDEMVAKAEGNETPTTESGENPDEANEQSKQLLAGKYKTEEDLQKGVLEILKKQNEGKDLEAIYKELESGLGTGDSGDEDVTTQDNPLEIDTTTETNEDTTDGDVEETENTETKNQVDFGKYEKELYENNGTLSDDSYKELEDAGFPKQVVDQYIRGLQATAQAEAQEVFNVTDGQENYQNMINWAKDNLGEAEQRAFNAQVNAADPTVRKFAVEALYSRYTKANGNPPRNLIQGDSPSNIGRDVYESRAQMMEDMRNPKYKSDSAYRRKVQEKIARSDIL